MLPRVFLSVLIGFATGIAPCDSADDGIDDSSGPPITLSKDGHFLLIQSSELRDGPVRINYLEAYCRPGSTDADWVKHTVIPHRTSEVRLNANRTQLRQRDELDDGVIVDHIVTAGQDFVAFEIVAHNASDKPSQAHWAQPCVRLGPFTGYSDPRGNRDDYLHRCFVFLDGRITRMPTDRWATKARYTPGQVWCPKGVPRSDVNPRPLSSLVPSNGLIGAFSKDETQIFAITFEPFQELFQGVARCLHSDFRIGGLMPGETKKIRGRMYLVKNDVPGLLSRYRKDFPEHFVTPGDETSSPAQSEQSQDCPVSPTGQ